MEELLVYALLLYEGFSVDKEYQNRLDALFLENPTDDFLLDLEFLSSNLKDSIAYIITKFDYNHFDHDSFGRFLMQKLKPCYDSTDIKEFAGRMYSLWESLPGNIQEEPPFNILCYADDPLSWGDEAHTRELYEHMLDYYSCSV